MAHPLDGARAKLARAADHLEVLDATLTRFVKDGGFRVTWEENSETAEYVLRIYSSLQPPVPPPLVASAMVGDFLHDARSALDHLVWALAKRPNKTNQFPIFDDPEIFKKKRGRYLRSVPKELWAQFEAYQPYPGRDANRVLAVVANLNDVDKHHLLLAGALAIAGRRGRFSGSGIDSLTIKGRDWVPFEDGAEIYRVSIKASGGPVKMNAEVPFTIVFRDPDSAWAVSLQDMRIIRISVSNVVESFAGAFPPPA